VEAIYAEADVPSEFQANIGFNASEAARLKDGGAAAIVKKKDPLRRRRHGRRSWAIEAGAGQPPYI